MSEQSQESHPKGPSPIGEISQEPSAFEAFLDAHQKKLLLLGIVAIIALVIFVVVDGLQKIENEKAAAEVAAARTVPEYESVAQKHASRNAGGSALIYKAQLQWRDQQKQEAIKTLEGMIQSYPEHPAIDSALSTLASYQHQEGNIEKAKENFQAASEKNGPTSSLALLALGDIAREEGDLVKAKELYTSIVDQFSTSHPQVKTLAEQRIELVGVTPPSEATPAPAEAPQDDLTPSATSNPLSIPTGEAAPSPTEPENGSTPQDNPLETPAESSSAPTSEASPEETQNQGSSDSAAEEQTNPTQGSN